MKRHLIDLSIVVAILLVAAVVARCEETNKTSKVEAPTTITTITSFSELKHDGPLSHFQMYGISTNVQILRAQKVFIETITISNTFMRTFSWNPVSKSWVTNDNIPSAIAPVVLHRETNWIDVPVQKQ